MKTPPLLLGAALLFWGWQSDFLAAGAIMGVILESARVTNIRWDLSDDEIRRILTFCTVLALATAVYAFASNEEGGSFGGLIHGTGAVHNATMTTVRASTAFFRWLPMTLFLFAAAQLFSTREKIPWTAISVFSRWRARRNHGSGGTAASGGVNISYPYFFVCLFSAGIHSNEGGGSFFWGQCALIVWALWPFRSQHFGILAWIGMLLAVIVFGFSSQSGIGALNRVLEGADVQWLVRLMRQRADPLQAVTAMGRIGNLQLSGRIVIRLRTENNEAPPDYLREASYRNYSPWKQSWFAGGQGNFFENIFPETNQTTWVLLPGKTNTASANIACYLDGGKALLPLPTGSRRLENLRAFLLSKNSEGAVLAEGPGLVIFDARYGSGATIDSPPDSRTNSLDLVVPTNEVPALNRIISEMNISGADERQVLEVVDAFFQKNFTYSLWQGRDKSATTNQTPLTRFLLATRSGHCEYFATATVLLLRKMGIPARYAVGYFVHEKSGRGYVVRDHDAHAWCLVWNRQTGTWEDFDTTPASWVGIENKRASVMQWLSDTWSWIGFQISKFRWGQSNLRDYILWGLIPVLAVLLYQIIFRRGHRHQKKQQDKKSGAAVFWPGLDSEFYLLEKKLAARGPAGAGRQPGEPLSGWLARSLEESALADLRVPLRELLQLHYRYRFDPRGLSETERQTLTREAKNCLEALLRSPECGEP